MESDSYQKADFIEISVDEFIPSPELLVDLYIHLSDSKFVRIAKAGDKVQLEGLYGYDDQDPYRFFVKNEDYDLYLEKSLRIVEKIIGFPQLPQEQKEESLVKMAANVFAEIEAREMSSKSYSHCKNLVNATVSFCLSKADLKQLLTHFASLCSSALYSHSVAVSIVSVMLGIELGWQQRTLEKLGLGGLLHDIGLKGLHPSLRNRSRALMTYEEMVEYESHAFLGMEILRALPEIDEDIIAVAFQHHEHGMGFGFPRRLKQFFINPYARVVGLANEFCNLTLPHLNDQKLKNPAEALYAIEHVLGQPYWRPAFKALGCLVEGK